MRRPQQIDVMVANVFATSTNDEERQEAIARMMHHMMHDALLVTIAPHDVARVMCSIAVDINDAYNAGQLD